MEALCLVRLWTDQPEKLAKTVLSIMVKCLYGGPEFFCKALGDFLVGENTPIVNSINNCGGQVVTILADGHQTNQNSFQQLNTVPGKNLFFNLVVKTLFVLRGLCLFVNSLFGKLLEGLNVSFMSNGHSSSQ